MPTADELSTKGWKLIDLRPAEEGQGAFGIGPELDSAIYEEAQKLFEEALQLESDHGRAREGLEACKEMLTPYYPVQHMMAPSMMEPVEPPQPIDLEAVGDAPAIEETEPPKPWEIRAGMRAAQDEGVRYTAKVQGDARDNAEARIAEIVAQAMSARGDAITNFGIALEQLLEVQEKYSHVFKGPGPNLIDPFVAKLRTDLRLDSVAESDARRTLAQIAEVYERAFVDEEELERLNRGFTSRWGIHLEQDLIHEMAMARKERLKKGLKEFQQVREQL